MNCFQAILKDLNLRSDKNITEIGFLYDLKRVWASTEANWKIVRHNNVNWQNAEQRRKRWTKLKGTTVTDLNMRSRISQGYLSPRRSETRKKITQIQESITITQTEADLQIIRRNNMVEMINTSCNLKWDRSKEDGDEVAT